MLATDLIGGAAALGSAIYGAVQSRNENEKARKLISDQKAKNEAWYNIRMNQDYTERSDAKAAINKQRELLNEHYKTISATNAVAGGSDNSLAQQKEQANKSVSDTMSNIAENAANYKEGVENQYIQTDNALSQQQIQGHYNQANAIAQAASQGVNAGVNLIGAGQDANAQKVIAGLKKKEE